jgi:hypothetical protein
VVIGIDYIGSCKSNYLTITTTTAPLCILDIMTKFYFKATRQIKKNKTKSTVNNPKNALISL